MVGLYPRYLHQRAPRNPRIAVIGLRENATAEQNELKVSKGRSVQGFFKMLGSRRLFQRWDLFQMVVGCSITEITDGKSKTKKENKIIQANRYSCVLI